MRSRTFLEVAAGMGLFCFGLAALVYATHLVWAKQHQTPVTSSMPKPVAHDFTLVQLGTMRRDQFLVDRSSGRIWESVCDGDVAGADCKGQQIFDEMYVSGVTPEYSEAAKLHALIHPNR